LSFVHYLVAAMDARDDVVLVQASQRGDHAAFEQLIKRYERQIANLIYMTMGNSDSVDDLSQEVFIRVYRSLKNFKFDASVFSWMYRIAMNLCIDEIRKRKIRRVVSLEFLTEDALERTRKHKHQDLPSDAMMKEEKKKIVQLAIQQLTQEHREVILLRESQDYSYTEIAETLDIKIEAVKSRIFRARKELKKKLERYIEV
jgi:RNA polymerase sigma-70 factor (ECF subfamily)